VNRPEQPPSERRLGETLRTAIEGTLAAAERSAKAGSSALQGGRSAELVDEIVRRGRDARDELTRRGQEAGAAIERRGQEARGEVAKRLEVLERRLASIEELLRSQSKSKPEG
jgi:polyhydroxyalkanoate synthesis regulator phasin